MTDGIINETKNSRLMKADLPATYDQMRTLAATGGLPFDLLINLPGWLQIPTWLNKANLLAAATAAKFGGVQTVNEALSKSGSMHANSLARDLNIMLNLSLGTSNIDAWADFLSDASKINTGSSSEYMIVSGALKLLKPAQTKNDNVRAFGQTSSHFVGQTFTAVSQNVLSVKMSLIKEGGPTDAVKLSIYATSAGAPTTKLYDSTNTIAAASISASVKADFEFSFLNVALTPGTMYALVLSRTGTNNTSNYYNAGFTITPSYVSASGSQVQYNNSTWTVNTSWALYFEITTATVGVATWNPVTATEPFVKMAVAADLTLGTGTITFYVSHNGTTWTQITALNAAQAVSFTGTSIYLKAVITGNAALSSVAWGGY